MIGVALLGRLYAADCCFHSLGHSFEVLPQEVDPGVDFGLCHLRCDGDLTVIQRGPASNRDVSHRRNWWAFAISSAEDVKIESPNCLGHISIIPDEGGITLR
ncbi:hypothetical protein [Sphingomonas sp. VL_57B]|uniref:hypothetical protein n=1 Tax=Sphingomonas sp. VL_57B TaxID=3144220 RepID=UPI0031F4DD3C